MKKLMYLFVAAIMFAFTACGGGEAADAEAPAEAPAEDTTAAEEAEPAEEAEANEETAE